MHRGKGNKMTINGVIDHLNTLLNADDVPFYYKPTIKKIIETIEQEKQQQWIPCLKRLPEEHEWIGTKRFGTTISNEVYVTFEASNGERFCDHVRFQNGKLSESKQVELNAIAKSIKPIAWRELPESYKGEK